MEAYDPTADLPPVPTFEVSSANFDDGGPLAASQYATGAVPGGRDASPQLTWSGWPEAARSFAVTMATGTSFSAMSFLSSRSTCAWMFASTSGNVSASSPSGVVEAAMR